MTDDRRRRTEETIYTCELRKEQRIHKSDAKIQNPEFRRKGSKPNSFMTGSTISTISRFEL